MRRKYTLFVLMIHVAVLQGVYYVPKLPATVATHFNAAGVPDRWLAKSPFLIARIALTVSTSLFFIVLPLALAKLPLGWIKLPRSGYWLAPSRREETFRLIRERLIELGAATLIFLIAGFQLVIDANLTRVHYFPIWIFRIFLMAYIVFGLIWALRFYLAFARGRVGDRPVRH